MLMVNQLAGFGAFSAGGGVAAVAFTAHSSQEAIQDIYTFSTLSFGTESADRHIIVGVTARAGGAFTIDSVTIGGVSATPIASVTSGTDNKAALFIAAVPTGATGDVVVDTGGADPARMAVVVWAATGLSGTAAHDTSTSTAAPLAAATFDVPANGIAVGVAFTQAAATATWANLSENADAQIAATNSYSGASVAFATTQTSLAVTCTWTTSTTPAGAFASWAPAS